MLPTVVLVGRPNVGKSTLFNRLTRSRAALVADYPGLTRDRHYARARVGERPCIVVDTGGFEPEAADGIMHAMAQQTRTAIAEADAVIFMVDGREGLIADDRAIADMLRRSGRPIVLAVNKCEGLAPENATAEFHELGLGTPIAISAAHGENVRELAEAALALCGEDAAAELQEDADQGAARRIAVAIVGRPNVGKSTLVNTLLGEERVIAFGEPGTTRDSLYLDFDRGSRHYTLIDTAGLRRRGKVNEAIEKFSVIKTLQAIEDANVVVLVLDAQAGIAEHDAHLAGYIVEAGRALVVAVNKWDDLHSAARDDIKRDLDRKLGFLAFAQTHTISARDGTGISPLLKSVDQAYAAAVAKLPTPRLTRALQDAVVKQQPPRTGLVRPKLRYAHQGGVNPPVIVIHGSALRTVPDTYRRYLERFFLEAFQLRGTPLRIQFKTAANPYADTPAHRRGRRQERRSRRAANRG
ncbi:MAG: ribosome biogenesis GTPase Der [Betaproteobacteria bacterium]|nr:MAG: ribosome biogenesis GTPase Der [Betaproteobacteria bacterium]